MALYVANLTKQIWEMHYWVPNSRKPVFTKIQPFSQASIYPQGSRLDHESIVDQHKMYGLIPLAELDRTKGYIRHVYQFDTPVPLDRLHSMDERNEDALVEESLERRKEAAIAMDDTMKRTAQETDTKIGSFEVELEEVEQKGVEPQIHEVITVGDENQQPRRRGRPRKS
ncbi:hypothetical protein [Paraburkholderia sp. J11-2]|uniref:hypothetical protein n=1 Tax=Paraburkholderia sp. J11-2 TaxID=2805431 RepID=UPI002AB7F2A1|nr:hypothetical protein [Paraburkholderia sp. J11-2]